MTVYIHGPQRFSKKTPKEAYENSFKVVYAHAVKDDMEFIEEVQKSSESGTPVVQPAPTRAYKEFQREPRVAYVDYSV
jgi:hypothetical protein